MTSDLLVNAYSRQNLAWLIFCKPINLIIAYHIRWQDCQECCRPFLPHRDANLPSISLIIGRRSNTFVIDASNRLFDLNQKWQPWRLPSDNFSLAEPFPTYASSCVRLTWDRSKISKLDTRKRVRWDRAGFLDGSKQTSKIHFYVVNYRSRWCKGAYLIIEMSNLNEGIK